MMARAVLAAQNDGHTFGSGGLEIEAQLINKKPIIEMMMHITII
jgi:hypothetical protein